MLQFILLTMVSNAIWLRLSAFLLELLVFWIVYQCIPTVWICNTKGNVVRPENSSFSAWFVIVGKWCGKQLLERREVKRARPFSFRHPLKHCHFEQSQVFENSNVCTWMVYLSSQEPCPPRWQLFFWWTDISNWSSPFKLKTFYWAERRAARGEAACWLA